MLRYLIQKDSVSKYILIYDNFKARPMKETNLIEGFKVIIDIKPQHDPFIYVYKPTGDIKEWWLICGSKDAEHQDRLYDVAKQMFQKQFLQLRV